MKTTEVKRTYKNVEEGGVVVIVQDFFIQLLRNAAVHLVDKLQVKLNPHVSHWQTGKRAATSQLSVTGSHFLVIIQ